MAPARNALYAVDQIAVFGWDSSEALQPIARRQMHDQRIKPWSFFYREDSSGRFRFQRIRGKAVNSFSGQRHHFAGPEKFDSARNSRVVRCV